MKSLKSIVWKEGKHYTAQCLNVDVASFGKTQKEALAALKEALELYFEDTKSRGVSRVSNTFIADLVV